MENTKNWTTITESHFPREREALEFARQQFPTHEPYRAWSNFEFIADDGSINEVDLLIFSREGFFLIEIKSRPGRLSGDAGTWLWETESKRFTTDNPLIAANTKAKKLASLLQRQKVSKKKGRLPYLETLVFCSAPDLRCELQGTARYHICLRDQEREGDRPARPGVMAAIQRRDCPELDPRPKGTHDKPTAKTISQALEQAGIRPSQRHRRVGDYVLAEGSIVATDEEQLLSRTNQLLEQRLAAVSGTAPMFSAALRGYRQAQVTGQQAVADSILAWLAGQPNVAAGAKRAAGVKGDIDHFGALNFLQGVLTILRDSGQAGLLLVLDEVETIQRVRSDARDKSLNALRQLIDEIYSGRFPGLYLVITGTPAFFDGPQGVQRLEPLAQRLHVDFQTDARFDNPRAPQLRLQAFTLERLYLVGCKIRDIFCQHTASAERIQRLCDDAYMQDFAQAVAGKLGGKVGLAPRIFLKKLVADVLDRVDQFPDFHPRQHYTLTLQDLELTPVERQALAATDVDDIKLIEMDL